MKNLPVNQIAFLLVLISLTFSCDKANIPIQRETVLEDVADIKKTLTIGDSAKIEYLDMLCEYTVGFEKLVEEKNGESELLKDFINKEAYQNSMDSLFSEAKRKGYTYRDLLTEVDTLTNVKKSYEQAYQNLFRKIDSACIQIQNRIDSNEINNKKISDLVKESISVKLLSISKSEYDYSNDIEVKFLIRNDFPKPIYALSFQAVLTDRLGATVAILICKSNETVIRNFVGTWTFEKYGDNSETYKGLENVEARHVTVNYTIKKVNIGGKIIGVDTPILGDMENLECNRNLKFNPKKHHGYCGYFKKDHPLELEYKNLNDKVDKVYSSKNLMITRLIGNLTIYKYD